jgi:GntR family transcriptional regulator, transcriptional repressor for pyruvate dehydrogenase complex
MDEKPAQPLFTPVEAPRVFKEVLVQLEDAIVAGRLVAGDRLPAERELAQQFAVSRTSVREALRVLEALGVLRVRPGPEHGATLVDGGGNALRDVLQFQLALHHISIASLIEFRLVIESWSASAAAVRSGDDDVSELERLASEMKAPGLEPEPWQNLDVSFHVEIARLSGNELLAVVLEAARNATQRVMNEAINAAGDWEKVRRRLVREHDEILRAIVARDGEEASRAVVAHIERFYRQMFSPDGAPSATPSLRLRDAGEPAGTPG